MAEPRWVRLTASLAVLLGLTGVWLGHALEYLRVWGTEGIDRALVGSAHVYMLPLGLVLATGAALAARRAWSTWQQLARRLDRAASMLRRALRGERPEIDHMRAVESPPSWGARMLSLGAALACAQISVYVVQENLEALALHQPAPLLGAVTGIHWAAALIQLDLAFLLLAAAVFVLRRFRSRVERLQHIERLVRALRAALRPQPAPRRGPLCFATPDAWLPGYAWARPPPSR
jgi:hypothetical protein